jgi:hypothetical protein
MIWGFLTSESSTQYDVKKWLLQLANLAYLCPEATYHTRCTDTLILYLKKFHHRRLRGWRCPKFSLRKLRIATHLFPQFKPSNILIYNLNIYTKYHVKNSYNSQHPNNTQSSLKKNSGRLETWVIRLCLSPH